jgi:hypothetical protein
MYISLHIKYPLGRPRTSDFSRCDYHTAQMKHKVLYGSARTRNYLIAAIKKSQRVPFPGRQDCCWTAACTNETHRNKWERTRGQLSPPYLITVWNQHRPRPFPGRRVILTQRICYRYGIQRGVWLWNIDFINSKSPALYGCWLKEYSFKVLKDRLLGKVWKAVVSESS